MREIRWAVLGTGVIANEMAAALEKNGKKLYAVGNRTYEKAVKFGKKYGIGKVYTDYNEMFTGESADSWSLISLTSPIEVGPLKEPTAGVSCAETPRELPRSVEARTAADKMEKSRF